MEIRYSGKSNANFISSMGEGNVPCKECSEKAPEVVPDEQFSMWFALAKSHILLGSTTIQLRLGEAEQWAILRR